MKLYAITSLLCLITNLIYGQQRSVAITIDDVPNVQLYQSNKYVPEFLNKLDSLLLPIGIFINEGNLYQNETPEKNKDLLKKWVLKNYITVGNHSFSHQNYGETGFEKFSEDILKGEKFTKEILESSGKTMGYFRFPFNSLGKDSLAHQKIQEFLTKKKYISTPFTIESEDGLYAELYNEAISAKDKIAADKIGVQYVTMTLKIFDYFDSLSVAKYGRPIKQIYLCHDSKLNTDFLPVIIQKLKDKKYRFLSLADAMNDPVYKSNDYYQGNFGYSWMYRWMQDTAERRAAMRAEPSNPNLYKAFEEMKKKK